MGWFDKAVKAVSNTGKSAGKSAVKSFSRAGSFLGNQTKYIGRKTIGGGRFLGRKIGVSKYIGNIKKSLLDPITKKTLNLSNKLEHALSMIPYANEALNVITLDPRINSMVESYKLRKNITEKILKNDWDGVVDVMVDEGLDPKKYLPKKLQYGLHLYSKRNDIKKIFIDKNEQNIINYNRKKKIKRLLRRKI
jgi:hypothetical protein